MSEIEWAIEKKEYIERGALIAFVREVRKKLPKDSKDFFTRDEMLLNFQQYLELQKAADVEPVVRGEWLNFVGDYVTAECSVCGECYDPSDYNDKEHFDMFKQLYKYCPNCGAKMDGEKEGAE
jgi:hypothetical protein